ncbi:NADH-quinone oxidoreductase subunit J [bacterium]|nr:MAG: NADH-quinone oxidoreductase subunit J [bacterium]
MEGFLFWFCGGLMVLGGLMTVLQRNAVVSAVWLVFAFINAAGIFAALDAPFLAVMQVLVYAGAIMVLFLFVIMMLQEPTLADERRLLRLPLWPAVALPPAAVIVLLAGWFRESGTSGLGPAPAAGFGGPEHIAGLLLGRYVLAFELISIVLLVAIIGALAVGKDERKLPWK